MSASTHRSGLQMNAVNKRRASPQRRFTLGLVAIAAVAVAFFPTRDHRRLRTWPAVDLTKENAELVEELVEASFRVEDPDDCLSFGEQIFAEWVHPDLGSQLFRLRGQLRHGGHIGWRVPSGAAMRISLWCHGKSVRLEGLHGTTTFRAPFQELHVRPSEPLTLVEVDEEGFGPWMQRWIEVDYGRELGVYRAVPPFAITRASVSKGIILRRKDRWTCIPESSARQAKLRTSLDQEAQPVEIALMWHPSSTPDLELLIARSTGEGASGWSPRTLRPSPGQEQFRTTLAPGFYWLSWRHGQERRVHAGRHTIEAGAPLPIKLVVPSFEKLECNVVNEDIVTRWLGESSWTVKAKSQYYRRHNGVVSVPRWIRNPAAKPRMVRSDGVHTPLTVSGDREGRLTLGVSDSLALIEAHLPGIPGGHEVVLGRCCAFRQDSNSLIWRKGATFAHLSLSTLGQERQPRRQSVPTGSHEALRLLGLMGAPLDVMVYDGREGSSTRNKLLACVRFLPQSKRGEIEIDTNGRWIDVELDGPLLFGELRLRFANGIMNPSGLVQRGRVAKVWAPRHASHMELWDKADLQTRIALEPEQARVLFDTASPSASPR